MSILSSTNSGIYSTISAPLLRSRGYEEVEKEGRKNYEKDFAYKDNFALGAVTPEFKTVSLDV